MFACLHWVGGTDPSVAGGAGDGLLGLAESIGPEVEMLGPETAIVGLADVRAGDWPERLGAEVSVAVAPTPDLALLGALAGVGKGGRPLDVRDFEGLSIEWLESGALPGGDDLLPVLRLWGVRTFGEFRSLPRQQTAERAGVVALRLHDVLNGRAGRPLNPCRPPERHVVGIGFEDPVGTFDALVFQIRRGLQMLCDGLRARHRAAGSIRIRLDFERNEPLERLIRLPEPLGSAEALARPVEQVFENLRVPSGIVGFQLELEPVASARIQRGFWGRQLRRPECWPDTLARLRGLLGEDRVGVPQPEFSHRPDAFRILPSAAPRPERRAVAELPAVSVPLHRFRPPRVVAVASTRGGAHPCPQAILSGPLAGRILAVRGPFPTSGDWWERSCAWQRLEWDISLESRHLLRLAYLPPERWVLDGIYE